MESLLYTTGFVVVVEAGEAFDLRLCGQLQPAVQPASFWPSMLAEGGAVEEWLSPGVDLGPGAYVDWHAPEATYARKLRESQRHRGLSVFRG